MTCPRCQGCLGWSAEPISRFAGRCMEMLRCFNCGERIDPQILRQRRCMHPVNEDRHTMIMKRIQNLVARMTE